MNYLNLQLRIADNLELLSSTDNTTITANARPSLTQIKNKINDIYREELFPLLSDKFPDDFKQGTYPLSTYTATGTASASSTGTSLITTGSVFSNSMEGFTVQCPTSTSSTTTAKITIYTSATQVTLDTTIGDAWDNQVIYVLGNEYTFGGDTTDIKEIKAIYVKYDSTSTYFTKCERIDYEQAIEYGNEQFSKYQPYFYLTTLSVASVPTRAFGILPYPIAYNGQIKLMYIQRPPALNADGDEPLLSVPGISQVIIDGVTAWGLTMQVKLDLADRYRALYEKGKVALIQSYKPKVRSNPRVLRISQQFEAINKRGV